MTKSQSESEDNKLVTIFKTGDQVKMVIAKSILDSAGIFCFTKGEIVQSLFGWGSISGFNPFTGPMELQVESDRLDEAKDLLSDLIEDKSEDQ